MCLRSIHSTLPIIINNNSIDKLALTILHSISSNNKQSTMGKGYKLTSATGDGPKQCAFFFSDQGCRNGANCKFSHEANAAAVSPAANKARAMSVSSSSVCSSESEGEIVEEKRAGAYSSLVKPGDDSNPFFSVTAPPPPAAAPTPAPKKAKIEQQQSTDKKKDKKRKKSESSSPFDLGNETQPPSQKGTASTPRSMVAPKKSKTTTPNSTPASPPVGNFRSLQLPIASFSLPTSTSKPPTKEDNVSRPPTPQHEPAPSLPLPIATPAHSKWHAAVLATRSHPNYTSAFSFEKVQTYEYTNGLSSPHQWITTRPHGDWASNNPASIAIDCEMCETKDPVTGKTDTKALCRLSVVNGDNPSEVLLDTLVKPEWPVVDYRTWVNGIKKEDLDGVQFTLRHAQMFMNTLCSEQVSTLFVALLSWCTEVSSTIILSICTDFFHFQRHTRP